MSDEQELTITAQPEAEMSEYLRNKWLSQKWLGFMLAGGASSILTLWGKVSGEVFGWTITALYATFCGVNLAQKKVFNA